MSANITIVIGTAREGNVSSQVAAYLEEKMAAANGTVTLTSVADHVTKAVTVPSWGVGGVDTVPTAWSALVAATDTFVFVLPEYNHSFPGEWKILMDTLYKEYAGKRAYVVAVGGGQFAGARVMEHVMPVLVNFQFVIGAERLHVADAGTVFDTNDECTDETFSTRATQFAVAVVGS